ncbi:hypothetical protein [Bacteroides heparinolyticus]|uniref:hypothetical protein n=1 Tax=Prevotella heparinolytica TaxID=28113 RepID=UPI0028E54E3D|nr:hypothetical protein [Bacteroides heparinolyticus]
MKEFTNLTHPITRSKERKEYPKILFINRHTLNSNLSSLNSLMKNQVDSLKDEGYHITYIQGGEFNLDFIRNKMKGYNAVFLTSHGLYDEKKDLTWTITGQPLNDDNPNTFKLNPKTINEMLEARGDLSVLCFEENGENVSYYAFSETFLDRNYQKNDFNNTFWHSGCCQTMMGISNRYAKVLVNKGAKKVVGYSNTTVGVASVHNFVLILKQLLSGVSFFEIDSFIIQAPVFHTYESPGKDKPKGFLNIDENYDYSKGTKYQHIYKKEDNSFWYTTELVSYPADVDFRFPILKLEKHELKMILGNTEEIKIIGEGSGNYKLTADVANIVQATAQKDKIIVKAVNTGECNLTITDEENGIKEVCKIKVKPRLKLEKQELELISGNTGEIKIISEGSGNYKLTANVAGIIQATAQKDKIIVKGVNPGECNLTVTDEETGVKEVCKIKVKPRLKLEKHELEMISGNMEEVRFAGKGSGNYTLTTSVTGIVQATAGKDRITIRAVNPGKCNLTVTDVETGIKEVCKISVKTHQQKIDEIIPAEFVDKLKELDVPFHEGKNPPIINGCYLISPCVLAKTNIQRDFAIGHRFSDHTIRFYDQDNKTLRIKIEEWQANSKSNSIETSVTAGTGNKFTVYGKVKTVKMNNPAIYTVLGIVHSGELSNGSIKNSHYAFVMLEKNDPNNEYIAVGKARVVIDKDGVSPTTAIPTTKGLTRTSVEKSLTPFILRRPAEK